MAKLSCAICNREREESLMQVFYPTDEEKAAMVKLGEEKPLDRYGYCKGCIQTLKNPTTGLTFMRGMIQHHARSQGVTPEAAERAIDKFVGRVLERSRKH
jgi:hypothetical protein